MTFNFVNLTPDVRQFMLAEIQYDVDRNSIFISPRLSAVGQRDYLPLLTEAAEKHDEDWFAATLREMGRLKTEEIRHNKNGTTSTATVPETANKLLAHGEFNRYYMRALCRFAIESKILLLVIYRARPSEQKRTSSQSIEGMSISAEVLLTDLRIHNTQDFNDSRKTALGRPNSGMSVRLP
jgi:hypothetical protein